MGSINDLSARQRNIFIDGFGYQDDCVDGNDTPLCLPWLYTDFEIDASSDESIESAGRAYYESVREEIEGEGE